MYTEAHILDGTGFAKILYIQNDIFAGRMGCGVVVGKLAPHHGVNHLVSCDSTHVPAHNGLSIPKHSQAVAYFRYFLQLVRYKQRGYSL